jgi:hypothetical protein
MKNVLLKIRPGMDSISWEEFCKTHPAYSIALDGYVRGATRYDSRGPWLTLDHHEDVDRMATRATCAQVLLCVRQGLFDAFRDDQGRYARIYTNDCDEDVCLSWYLLKNPARSRVRTSVRLERLVHAVDLLDTTAGASIHPLDDVLMGEMAWIFDPYRQARRQGILDVPDQNTYRVVIEAVFSRIDDYVADRGGCLPLDTRYERIGRGSDWAMVRELGQQSRLGMLKDGIRAYVSVRSRTDGARAYTIGRASPFIAFDLPTILAELNLAEPMSTGRWGGGNLVGGSPRRHGSALQPREVARIINRVLEHSSPETRLRVSAAPSYTAFASG